MRGDFRCLDGKHTVCVWEVFPTGSTSFAFPHAVVVPVGSSEKIKVSLKRLRSLSADGPKQPGHPVTCMRRCCAPQVRS